MSRETMNTFQVLYCLSTWILTVESAGSIATLGFPNSWDGDKFHNVSCASQSVPRWLDGYFMIQICGSYGNQTNAIGSKVTHMFDAIGAVGSLEIKNGEVRFSAEYYPSKANRIWNFYNRNMNQTRLAWHPVRSAFNQTAVATWESIVKNDEITFPIHPNFNFWLVGNKIVAATEIYQIGMQFNVSSLTDFTSLKLKEISNSSPSLTVLSVGAQERKSSNGIIYAASTAYDPIVNKMYHLIYAINSNGIRTIEGVHEYNAYDPSSCNDDGSYNGDKTNLAGYIHSISSTKSYVILPIGSNVINPCKLQPLNKNNRTDIDEDVKIDNPAMEFVQNHPVRFLIFDKMNKQFITPTPINVGISSVFITSQINAYEDGNGIIIADMIGVENVNPYDILTTERLINLTAGNNSPTLNLYRFRINARSGDNQPSPIFTKINYEQPSYNRNLEETVYRFAYTLKNPFTLGNSILKIDLSSQSIINEFKAPNTNIVFREPWFVPKNKTSSDEDDGVILFLGGDISSEKSSLFILDAKNFSMLGCSILPTFVPFGFNSRYFTKDDLICNTTCQLQQLNDNLQVPFGNQVVFNNQNQSGFNNQNQIGFNNSNQTGFNNSNQFGFNNPNQYVFNNQNQTGYNNSNQFGFNNPNQIGFNNTNQIGFNNSNQFGFNNSNQFGLNNFNQNNQNGAVSSIVQMTTSGINSMNLNEGFTQFSRIDNVTVYPQVSNQTVAREISTSPYTIPDYTTSGNNGFVIGNSSDTSSSLPTVYESDSTSSTEFFRTTTFDESSEEIISGVPLTIPDLSTTMISINGVDDNYSPNCPPNQIESSSWLRFLRSSRKFICSYLKAPIDNTGIDFCHLNVTAC